MHRIRAGGHGVRDSLNPNSIHRCPARAPRDTIRVPQTAVDDQNPHRNDENEHTPTPKWINRPITLIASPCCPNPPQGNDIDILKNKCVCSRNPGGLHTANTPPVLSLARLTSNHPEITSTATSTPQKRKGGKKKKPESPHHRHLHATRRSSLKAHSQTCAHVTISLPRIAQNLQPFNSNTGSRSTQHPHSFTSRTNRSMTCASIHAPPIAQLPSPHALETSSFPAAIPLF